MLAEWCERFYRNWTSWQRPRRYWLTRIMSEGKKRKLGYIDRTQTLSNSRKLPNVLPRTQAVVSQRNRKYTFACKFKHRLTVPGDDSVLDALVLENDICVLLCKEPVRGAGKVVFPFNLTTEGVSGRMKKGAQVLKAGTKISTISLANGTTVNFTTPVGGKLLELNDRIIAEPSLLENSHDNEGFIAILYPDTEIPSLEGYTDYESLMQSCSGKIMPKGVCFSFQQGACSRGESCRFKHVLVEK